MSELIAEYVLLKDRTIGVIIRRITVGQPTVLLAMVYREPGEIFPTYRGIEYRREIANSKAICCMYGSTIRHNSLAGV